MPSAGVLFFLDACQSMGQLPVDVGRIGCAVATGTGRKWLRGPRGTGLLYVRRDLAGSLVPPGVDGRSAEWEDRDALPAPTTAWPASSPSSTRWRCTSGLGTAVDHVHELGIGAIAAQVGRIAEHLRAELGSVEGVAVHDGGHRRCGIVTFTVDGVPPPVVKEAAAAAGVQVWISGSAAARLDMGGARPDEVVRASPHYFTTPDECGRLVEVVADLAPG